MTDTGSDLLLSATAALRDLTAGPEAMSDPPAEHTRRRVMASLGERRQGHRRRLAFAVFAFALSTATLSWAASSGRLTKVLQRLHIVDAAPVAPAVAPDPRDGLRRVRAPEPAQPAVVAVVAAPELPVAPPVSIDRPRPARPRPRVAVAPPAPEAPALPAEDRDTASYRHAHALHFRGGDATATLAAWDAYLAGFPRGRFATEAAYNRAITLVRLDRKAEARAALAPFAAGSIDDGYRRAEATALREALGRE